MTVADGGAAGSGEVTAACPFCRIVAGEAPSWVVYEDGSTVAFLDRRPLFPGHTLLVPRDHVATLPELPPHLVAPLFSATRLLAAAIQEAADAEGTFVAMNNRVSQSVPHLHVHIVPRRRHDGLKGFFWPRSAYADAGEAERIGEKIRRAVAARQAVP